MKKFIGVVLSLVLVGTIFINPLNTSAKTLAEFESEVAAYTSVLQSKKNAIAKNDAEVAEIKKKISSIEGQIAQATQDMKKLQDEIDKSNEEIKKKNEESKKIMEYYQVSGGENVYLEYAFGAKDITDMIYRMSVVEQLTEYNDKIMKELQELIKVNKEKKVALDAKKKELAKLEKDLETQKARINAESAAIRETMPGVQEQIKAAQANVKYYKSLGCGRNEDINACQYRIIQSNSGGGGGGGGSVPSTNGFYRPMEYGYLTQGYGGAHMGVDLSSSNKTIPIYPIASGQVFAKYYDVYGALVVKIRHNVGGRFIYSTYAHLSSFAAISVGQNVSHLTMIGNMGSTGYSTGPHLHLELTSCDWHAGGGCTWGEYVQRTIAPTTYVSIPSSWSNR